MKAFQDRVVEEKRQLDDRLAKLRFFIHAKDTYAQLPQAEQMRMSEQLEVMTRYSTILGERIKNFTSEQSTST